MLNPHKVLLCSALLALANLAQAQAASDTSAAPPVTATAPVSVSPPASAQASEDPLIQRRIEKKQAKDEYKARKKLAKQDYKSEKKAADVKLKTAKQLEPAHPADEATSSGK